MENRDTKPPLGEKSVEFSFDSDGNRVTYWASYLVKAPSQKLSLKF